MSFLTKIFGDTNERYLRKKLWPIVYRINSLESEFAQKSDQELRETTDGLKAELAKGKTLDDILPYAFAAAREAAKRSIGQRHFDVQLIGGLVLHHGQIAEMRTGEGKTLTATLAVYLNALSGKGVHVVTVNDYLARRDTVWMGKIYDFLGLSVGCIQHEKSYLYDPHVIASEFERHSEPSPPHQVRGQGKLRGESQGLTQDSSASPQNDDEETGVRDDIGETAPLVSIDYDYLRPSTRQESYSADVTYGTNNEFGFDYLRDNMAPTAAHLAQRELNFAVVDEVDSILIDEARTPLIISGPDDRPTDQYFRFAELVRKLSENEDYNVDEKMHSATLTEAGIKKMEGALGMENIYAEGGLEMVHHIEQALKARTLFTRDKDYVVREGEVIIVDEFTGRLMFGRRYSEGLHQAIEAKEGVEIKQESRTLATITFQNLFRLYGKLSGMTGTAATEAEEFHKIYNLDVVVVPTNQNMVRRDLADRVYKNRAGKYQAVVEEVKERHKAGQPILLGTISIEHNEYLSELLTRSGVPHEILNAKNHEREAEIIAQAGRKGAVTLATNMAGRGVDIILGGNPPDATEAEEVRRLGGLHVLGTERHEARRIDNQLRGRSGRQGDPGESQFFVSLDDDLMRIFGSDRLKNMMTRLGVPDDMPIENKLVSRSIESAQHRVEGHNFDIRKHLVEYDDVINRHREAIYRRRRVILEGANPPLVPPLLRGGQGGVTSDDTPRAMIVEMIEKEIIQVVNFHTAALNYQDWNITEIEQTMRTILPPLSQSSPPFQGGARGGSEGGVGAPGTDINLATLLPSDTERDKGNDAQMRTKIIDHLTAQARQVYEQTMSSLGEESSRLEQAVLLNSIDNRWVDHLQSIENLRTSIGLRGYGQRDPLVEYKREAYRLFQELLASIQNEVVYSVFKMALARQMADSPFIREFASRLARGNLRFSAPAKTMTPLRQGFGGQAEQSESPVASSSANGVTIEVPSPFKGEGRACPAPRIKYGAGFDAGVRVDGKKVGRNDPCHCGSGKKFKKCHRA